MKDEEYLFVSDSRDKKITARSAGKRRTHNGKRGSVRFPSDHLTKKEFDQRFLQQEDRGDHRQCGLQEILGVHGGP